VPKVITQQWGSLTIVFCRIPLESAIYMVSNAG